MNENDVEAEQSKNKIPVTITNNGINIYLVSNQPFIENPEKTLRLLCLFNNKNNYSRKKLTKRFKNTDEIHYMTSFMRKNSVHVSWLFYI